MAKLQKNLQKCMLIYTLTIYIFVHEKIQSWIMSWDILLYKWKKVVEIINLEFCGSMNWEHAYKKGTSWAGPCLQKGGIYYLTSKGSCGCGLGGHNHGHLGLMHHQKYTTGNLRLDLEYLQTFGLCLTSNPQQGTSAWPLVLYRTSRVRVNG